uniref:ELK domain-containing protein n=1 Tax=Arundo donax TaxID=35708 RepID=A0A0A9CL17_ARUDO
MACREIEQSLQDLTGATLEEGTGATMSEDEEEPPIMDGAMDMGSDGHDMMGFGPLLPTDSERSLMERVRQELKIELKQGFKSRIEDVREEIMRKRRAGKLPGDTTSILKQWWQQHSKWPYPTVSEYIVPIMHACKECNQPSTTTLYYIVILSCSPSNLLMIIKLERKMPP